MDQFNQYSDSSLLFVTPSFSRGISRLAVPYGRIDSYNYSPSGKVADTRATRSDWRAVGRDILHAMTTFRDEAVSLERNR